MNRILDYENLKNKITDWIYRYAIANGITTLVVGVSGGIDSAVVSTICAESGLNTIAIGLPIKSNPKNTELQNLQLSFLKEKYGTKTMEIDISEVFENFSSLIPEEYRIELGFANSKSRLRMLTLYQIAASCKGLVVGTGNKVEDFGIGFFTKYGDGGVDISPIADLYKTEVRELGKVLMLPKQIIEAEPTDGLWEDDRKDQEQIGVSYEELEWVMEVGLKKENPSFEERKIISIYKDFNKKNYHKMVSIPIFDLKKNNII